MNGENVTYEVEGPVAVITIDRHEKRNAVDGPTGDQLEAALERFADDGDADVGVVTGAGGTFCAGADLEAVSGEGAIGRREHGYMGFSHVDPGKPTIAAVEGHAIAGGLELACYCDLRVAAEDATFGCYERRWGVPLVDGGTQRLPRIVGLGRALEMIHTGRSVGAPEAREWGLVNRVVPPGEALDAASEMAGAIASFPQATVRADRRSVYAGLGEPLEKGLAVESWHGSGALETAREGAARFAGGEGRGGSGTYEELIDRDDA